MWYPRILKPKTEQGLAFFIKRRRKSDVLNLADRLEIKSGNLTYSDFCDQLAAVAFKTKTKARI